MKVTTQDGVTFTLVQEGPSEDAAFVDSLFANGQVKYLDYVRGPRADHGGWPVIGVKLKVIDRRTQAEESGNATRQAGKRLLELLGLDLAHCHDQVMLNELSAMLKSGAELQAQLAASLVHLNSLLQSTAAQKSEIVADELVGSHGGSPQSSIVLQEQATRGSAA